MGLKKGFFFSIDGVLALSIILICILLVTSFYINEPANLNMNYQSQDIVRILSILKISEINNDYVDDMVAAGQISRLNNTILEQIAEFWAEGKINESRNLTREFIEDYVDSKFGFNLTIGGDEIYSRPKQDIKNLATSRRIISGIEKEKPRYGFSSRALLKSIEGKTTYSYAYFGGFVGQGNITRYIFDIPNDANITGVYMELDSGDNFSLYINDIQCNGIFEIGPGNMTADFWDISSCNSSIDKGSSNKFVIVFEHGVNKGFIGGGYIKVKYRTQQWLEQLEINSTRYWFPGISGIVNLYSSFYVPGIINSTFIHLHFNSNYTTKFYIGNKLVLETEGSSSDQIVELNDTNLTSFPTLLDYNLLSNNTVPIRIASYNESVAIISGSNADVILITDMSGSMDWRLDQDYNNGNRRACDDPDIYTENDTQRLALAKCLGIEFTEVIMNESIPNNQNREWASDYNTNTDYFTNDLLQLNKDNLIAYLNTYNSGSKQPSGGTCIACSLNLAYNILNQFSNENRSKFVLLMTDGIASVCSNPWWWWFCDTSSSDTSGSYSPWGCVGDSNDCNTNDCNGPITNAINSAQRLYNQFNATIYTVGIGPIATFGCNKANYTLWKIANLSNGSYFASQDASELLEIYKQIGDDIQTRTTQKSQRVIIQGNVSPSVLYPDSYIEINYTSNTEAPQYGSISIKFQTDSFNSCNPSKYISSDVQVVDAKVTSYSGDHWTDFLEVNSIEEFNLSYFGINYDLLGDPYLVQAKHISSGTNNIRIRTGDGPENSTDCSDNNSVIFTGLIKSYIDYGEPLSSAEGCNWTIELEDSSLMNLKAPADYSGSKNCNFTSSSVEYDENDAYDVATYTILEQLDFDDDFRLDINFDEDDLTLDYVTISDVPSLWGPSIIDIRVWE